MSFEGLTLRIFSKKFEKFYSLIHFLNEIKLESSICYQTIEKLSVLILWIARCVLTKLLRLRLR